MYDRFRKFIGIALALLVILSGGAAKAADENVSIVYFTKDISPAGLLKVYDKVNAGITGKVAIKLHTGEPKGPNLLPLPHIGSATVETRAAMGALQRRNLQAVLAGDAAVTPVNAV